MIIDQANAAVESNGRFFNKTNRIDSPKTNQYQIIMDKKKIVLQQTNEFSKHMRILVFQIHMYGTLHDTQPDV